MSYFQVSKLRCAFFDDTHGFFHIISVHIRNQIRVLKFRNDLVTRLYSLIE